jgi:hypothetical protein
MSTLRQQQRGASLIELMVGMTIGLVILALSYQIFISSKATHNRILAQSRLQESGRFALNFINHSVRNTGYRFTQEKLPDLTFTDSNNRMVTGVDGTDLPVTGEPAPLSFSTRSVNVVVGGDTIALDNVATYSDVLVVRYQGGAEDGAVTDCAGDTVFGGVEELDEQGTADPSDDVNFFTLYAADIIYARVADSAEDGRSRFRLHCRRERIVQENGGTPYRYLNSSGSGSQFSALTLVEDVTAFQVELGVDTSGDQVVDVYQNFSAVPDLNRVRALRVTIDVKGGRTLDLLETVAAQTISTAETLQQQFTQTIALRNLTR